MRMVDARREQRFSANKKYLGSMSTSSDEDGAGVVAGAFASVGARENSVFAEGTRNLPSWPGGDKF